MTNRPSGRVHGSRGAALVVGVVAALGLVVPARAWIWSQAQDMPVERLVGALEKRLELAPDDARAHLLLGRVHGYAFEFASGVVPLESRIPRIDTDDWWRGVELAGREGQALARLRAFPRRDADPESLAARGTVFTDAQLLAHLEQAVLHLARARQLAPDDPVAPLGLSYVLERAAHLATRVSPVVRAAVDGDAGALVDDETRAFLTQVVFQLSDEASPARTWAFETLRDAGAAGRVALREHVLRLDPELDTAIAALFRDAWLDAAREAAFDAFELAPPPGESEVAAALPSHDGLLRLVRHEAALRFVELDERLSPDAPDARRPVVEAEVARLRAARATRRAECRRSWSTCARSTRPPRRSRARTRAPWPTLEGA